MTPLILFLFGAAIGSFLNVVILRYDGDHFLFDDKVLGGRSHCPHCKKTLHWYELVPIASFVVQGGKCRGCGASISFQYPVVELLSGLVFMLVPLRLVAWGLGAQGLIWLSIIWIAALEAILVAAWIDVRLGIIPDEINVFLIVLGIFNAIFFEGYVAAAAHSFLGPYAFVFGGQGTVWENHIAAALAAGAFFLLLVLVTPYIFKREGMGMGDAKLAAALGFLFGWPDVAVLTMLAFMLGAVVGISAVAIKVKDARGTLPFGPFLAAGAVLVFFCGAALFAWYFRALGVA